MEEGAFDLEEEVLFSWRIAVSCGGGCLLQLPECANFVDVLSLADRGVKGQIWYC